MADGLQRLYFIVCLFLTSHLGLSIGAVEAADRPINVGFVPTNSFYLDSEQTKGLLAPFTDCLLSQAFAVNYIEQPTYQRMMLSLEQGILDLGLNLVRTNARDKQAHYVSDLINTRTMLIKSKKTQFDPGSSIVGTRLGTHFISQLTAMGINADVKVQSFEQLIEMFNLGRIDAMVEAELFLVGKYEQIKGYPDELDYESISDVIGGGYFSFDYMEQHPKYLEGWAEQVGHCRRSFPQVP